MKLAIIGAGGFAREAKWLAQSTKFWQDLKPEFAGYLVSDLSKLTDRDSEVLGDLSWLESNHVDFLAIGIGSPAVRLTLGRELREKYPRIQWPALVHPTVQKDDSCIICNGAMICAGTVLTVNVCVKEFSLINLNCTIGHEACIGAGTVLSPTCAISGGVVLGDGVFLGSGVAIGQYLKIGDRATIGGGAMVLKDVSADTAVYGVPAKPKS